MSLINEALKKAQRQRNEGQPADAPPIPGGPPITKRATPRSANTIVLIGSGAVALIVISVVVTVYLLNRPNPQKVAAKAAATAAAAHKGTEAPASTSAAVTAPLGISPLAAPPGSDAAVKPATTETSATLVTPSPTPEAKSPAKSDYIAESKAHSPATTPAAPVSKPAIQPPSAPVAASTPATAPTPGASAAPAPALRDERIVAFVEGVRVAGIRASGTESRVLLNDRVYRVNDIVERNLGVRLIKVAIDSLTFADANGVTYMKYF